MDFRNAERMTDTDEGILEEPYKPFYNIFGSKPVLVKQYVETRKLLWFTNLTTDRNNEYDRVAFRETPWLGCLLFDNVSSDARDHAANERSELSLLVKTYSFS
jgi:hypothetical protein